MYDANQEKDISVTVNKYLHEHGLAYEGHYVGGPNNPTFSRATGDEFRVHYKNDNISHFVCRLAYCRNEELRKWFLQQEARLFNVRVQRADANKVLALMRENFSLSYD